MKDKSILMAENEQQILNSLNATRRGTLMETLDIEFVSFQDNILKAKMPVNNKVMQPFGKLHGGASMALIETVGSVLSLLQFENPIQYSVYGAQLSVSHINTVGSGEVIAAAHMIKKGKNLHIVRVEVKSNEGTLVTYALQTNSVKKHQNEP